MKVGGNLFSDRGREAFDDVGSLSLGGAKTVLFRCSDRNSFPCLRQHSFNTSFDSILKITRKLRQQGPGLGHWAGLWSRCRYVRFDAWSRWRGGIEEFTEHVEGDLLGLEKGLQEWVLEFATGLDDSGL